MVRQFNGKAIRQDSKTSFLNLNDLYEAYLATEPNTVKRIGQYITLQQTEEFADAIRESALEANVLNSNESCKLELPLLEPMKVIETRRGKYGGTWVHPYLFLDFAMWLNPRFKVWAMSVIEDKLIELRTEAGDKFKEMTSALKSIGAIGPREYIKEANMINTLVFKSTKPEQRNSATQEQLDLLNKLQKYNAHLITLGKNHSLRQRECENFIKFYNFIK